MLFGGRAAFFPETEIPFARASEILRRGMIGVYGATARHENRFVWAATLDFTLERDAAYGKDRPDVFRRGLRGPRRCRRHVVSARNSPASSAAIPMTFPSTASSSRRSTGLRSGNTWALPLAGAWYRILDFFNMIVSSE